MKKTLILAAISVAIFGLMSTTTAQAQVQQGAFIATPFVNYFSFSNKRHLKNAGGYGLELGYATNPNIEVAVNIGTTNPRQKDAPKKNNRVMQYGLNGYYYFGPYKQRLQPFLTGGVGIWNFSRNTDNSPATQTNLNVGAGLAIFMVQNISLNVGAKYFYTVTNGGRNDFNVNAGVSFFFGGHSADAGDPRLRS